MEYQNFKLTLKDNIIILTANKVNVTVEDLKNAYEFLTNTTHKIYECGTYRDIIGYYDGYDFINNIPIYCGTMSESVAIKKIKEYKQIKFKQ